MRNEPRRSGRRTESFDLVGPAYKDDPFPTHEAMRAVGPVLPVRLPLVGRVWTTSTFEATEAMAKGGPGGDLFVLEGRNVTGRRVRAGPAGMRWWMPRSLHAVADNMLGRDDPDHRRLRKLVDHAFARRDVQAMRPAVEALADRLLDRMAGTSEPVDLMTAYARRLPLDVICELLGLPESDRERFATLAEAFTRVSGALGVLRAFRGITGLSAYVRARIERVRADGARSDDGPPGLIAEMVRAERDGERLSESELVSMVILLLLAGFETTSNLICNAVVALERHPEQKAFWLADPDERTARGERTARAVEELARHSTPVLTTKPRFVSRDATFFGRPLKAGERVMPWLAAANDDPARFDAPGELRLDRFPNPHLVFSTGVHFCLGLQLARIETQVALERLYARFPDLALAEPEAIEWTRRPGTRGVARLPVTL